MALKRQMRNLESIHREIDELSDRRVDLWHELSEGYDASLQAEVRRLEERLEELWEEQRQLRAELRWGDRKRIIARARAEERLERHAA
jgi:ABC-type phosphate transport system auxiliary subunit